MSLSFPAHHPGLRPTSAHSVSHSRASTGSPNLTHHQSSSSLRGASPAFSSSSHDHHHDQPVDIQHEKERNWNSPRPVWHEGSFGEGTPPPSRPASLRHSHSSLSFRSGSPSLAHHHDHDHHDEQDKERNQHSPRPVWHEGSLENGHSTPYGRSLHHRRSSSSSLRSNSPSVNGHNDRHHHDQPDDRMHEKERNWNAPRRVRHDSSSSLHDHSHSHSHAANGKSPSITSHLPNGRARVESLRSTGGHSINRPLTPEPKQSSQSLSPMPPEQPSPTPSRSSSLQAIDNTYQNHGSGIRQPARSPSPLLSFKKDKKDTSSAASNRSKSQIASPAGRKAITPSRNPASIQPTPKTKSVVERGSEKRSPVQTKAASSPSLSLWNTGERDEPESTPKARVQDIETDGRLFSFLRF